MLRLGPMLMALFWEVAETGGYGTLLKEVRHRHTFEVLTFSSSSVPPWFLSTRTSHRVHPGTWHCAQVHGAKQPRTELWWSKMKCFSSKCSQRYFRHSSTNVTNIVIILLALWWIWRTVDGERRLSVLDIIEEPRSEVALAPRETVHGFSQVYNHFQSEDQAGAGLHFRDLSLKVM